MFMLWGPKLWKAAILPNTNKIKLIFQSKCLHPISKARLLNVVNDTLHTDLRPNRPERLPKVFISIPT